MRAFALLLLIVAVTVAGCGRDEELSVDGAAPTRNVDRSGDGYTVIMRGVVNDTLSGRAQFGDVYDQQTREVKTVLEFVTAADFAGGMFIVPVGSSWPEAGAYSLGDGRDSSGQGFRVVYRQGLYRAFSSRSGTLSLSTVTDTLIRGSFDAIMTGEVAERGREPVSGDVEVSGSFSARPGQPGYIIGL